MRNVARILKGYAETGALCEQVPLWGFIDKSTFLTKAGDMGVVLAVDGIDYECLDVVELEAVAKRLENAFRGLDERYRLYQYLFKRRVGDIPTTPHPNAVVRAAVEERAAYLRSKGDRLFEVELAWVVLAEGSRYHTSVSAAMRRILAEPRAAWRDLAGLFSTDRQAVLIEEHLERTHRQLLERVQTLVISLADVVGLKVLPREAAFQVLRRLLNFDPVKLATPLKYTTHLDYWLSDSTVEAHPAHLKVDDEFVFVATLKEPTSRTWPLILQAAYEVEAEYHIVSEWHQLPDERLRREIRSRRRHFFNSKTAITSQLNTDGGEVLEDEGKSAQIYALGQCQAEIELHGRRGGEYALTVVVHDRDLAVAQDATAKLCRVFQAHDGVLFPERTNALNAFFATLPGNGYTQLRSLMLLDSNATDYAFAFSLSQGERWSEHLDREYLATFETQQGTPFFYTLHQGDLGHTVLFGTTGAGKSFTLGYLLTHAQKYDPWTFIFDLGGSFEGLTQVFGGAYLRLSMEQRAASLNPFSLPPTKDNLAFLQNFLRMLAEESGPALTPEEQRRVFVAIRNLYELEPGVRRLGILVNTLTKSLAGRFAKWIKGGTYGDFFDNVEDSLECSRWLCCDFAGLDSCPDLVEALVFYLLQRIRSVIDDPKLAAELKLVVLDEGFRFLRQPTTRDFVLAGVKQFRKRNASVIFATQSLADLPAEDVLRPFVEACPTKLFLANPGADAELYAKVFDLNPGEMEIVKGLTQKRQIFLKRPRLAKVLNLDVSPRARWIYANDPKSNVRRAQAIARTGNYEAALDELVAAERGSQP